MMDKKELKVEEMEQVNGGMFYNMCLTTLAENTAELGQVGISVKVDENSNQELEMDTNLDYEVAPALVGLNREKLR